MLNRQNFAVQKKNSRAVNTLRSWLMAVGVEVRKSQERDSDLTVTCRNGEKIKVAVAMRQDELGAAQGSVTVLATDITGKKSAIALQAFHGITESAGWGKPRPFDRGPEPALNNNGNPRKLHYRDEEFLVAIRHTEFRRAPNPGPQKFRQYHNTIQRTAYSFHRLNYELCLTNLLEVQDLVQYGRCWTVNFCNHSEIEESEQVYHDNERKLYSYLQQRFLELRNILLKKGRSVLPDQETVSIALFGTVEHLEYTKMYGEKLSDSESDDYDYITRNCELDTSSASARQKSAKKKLEELLAMLPHDQLVNTLEATVANFCFDPGARSEASRRLREHRLACGCAPSEEIGSEEDEDSAGMDGTGTEE